MDLQELISRGRFIFAGAPQRLTIYKLVDGRKTAKLIAKLTKRYVTNVHGDLRRLADVFIRAIRGPLGEIDSHLRA